MIRERLPDLFESGSTAMEGQETREVDLHQKIGELTVDLDFLKKSPRNWASDPPPLVGRR